MKFLYGEEYRTAICKGIRSSTRVDIAVPYWEKGATQIFTLDQASAPVRIALGEIRDPDVVKELNALPNVTVKQFSGGLHATVFLFDSTAVIGSAGASPLSLGSNGEAGVVVEAVDDINAWFAGKIWKWATSVTAEKLENAQGGPFFDQLQQAYKSNLYMAIYQADNINAVEVEAKAMVKQRAGGGSDTPSKGIKDSDISAFDDFKNMQPGMCVIDVHAPEWDKGKAEYRGMWTTGDPFTYEGRTVFTALKMASMPVNPENKKAFSELRGFITEVIKEKKDAWRDLDSGNYCFLIPFAEVVAIYNKYKAKSKS